MEVARSLTFYGKILWAIRSRHRPECFAGAPCDVCVFMGAVATSQQCGWKKKAAGSRRSVSVSVDCP